MEITEKDIFHIRLQLASMPIATGFGGKFREMWRKVLNYVHTQLCVLIRDR
jgi:hypothetical protein